MMTDDDGSSSRSPLRPLGSMDNEAKFMITCLLFAAICSSVSSDEWKAIVVKSIDALVTSCVVVPCSFSHTGGNLPMSRLRAMWHYKGKTPDTKGNNIFHSDATLIKDNFKGRTKILGELGQKNCTLEITPVRDHDNGPFCFRVELVRTEGNEPTKDMFSFVEDCVELNMLSMSPTFHDFKHLYQFSIKSLCLLLYTQSILTFIPEEKDDNRELTCTAAFNGGLKSSATFTLSVKRIENYNHIIIPAVVGIGTALLFGIFCIFMAKKYKNRIAELQNQEGTMWNRLSRLSRRHFVLSCFLFICLFFLIQYLFGIVHPHSLWYFTHFRDGLTFRAQTPHCHCLTMISCFFCWWF
uniref:Ig-like domain-containing protein n=1 Tax=Oreochromis aureus TaxID=47969 RepID=A0A668TFW1_OREAU